MLRSYLRFNAALALSSIILGAFAGCAKEGPDLAPVTGKVQWKGGGPATELVNYNVSTQAAGQGSSSTGVVQADGTFMLSTLAENDGAMVGKHKVAIGAPMPEIDKPAPKPLIPDRYSDFEKSGLEIDVKPGENNVTLEVERR